MNLENNGNNLNKLYVDENNKTLNSSIPDFCPNLKSLYLSLYSNELDTLKNIFIKCQYLESIGILHRGKGITEKEIFEIVANYSSNDFHELKIFNSSIGHTIFSENLKHFLINWKNRISKKSLTLTIIRDLDEEIMKIIEKYKNLDVFRINTITLEEELKEEDIIYFCYWFLNILFVSVKFVIKIYICYFLL
ncbi:hypothetical protein GLOIN_2v1715049 [Rhizophagus clarus]|uniref:F-box domain-containing protein n=1 Tax=Rhizophagus clarus TaxID=94130 RepID=A0A8H3QQ87_9GLOM|nr:hypothetical protein GLOIN_2v1715049 [Rhizophagus clarus]